MMVSEQAAYFGIALRHLSFGSFLDPKSQNSEELGHAAIFFPLAGFIFGLGFMLFYFLISRIADLLWSCFLVMGFMVWVFNGRFYRDCIQFVEAGNFKSGLERDVVQVLLVFTLFMLKFLALTHLGQGWVLGMLVLMPTLSCWSLVYLMHSLPSNLFATGSGLIYARFVQRREFFGATLFTTAMAGVCMELEGLFLLMFMSIWTAIFERWVCLKNKFPLKHVVGMAMEFNEVLLLLGAIVLRKGFALSKTTGVWI